MRARAGVTVYGRGALEWCEISDAADFSLSPATFSRNLRHCAQNYGVVATPAIRAFRGFPPVVKKTNAQRSRDKRARQRAGVAVWRVPVVEYVILSAMIEAGRDRAIGGLTEAESLDPQKQAAAAWEVLAEWSKRWLK
jgi:hypothetical protein